MNLSTKILLGLVVALIAIGIGLYIHIENLTEELKKATNIVQVQEQNIEALKDQNKMKADSIQNYALMVGNLQTDKSRLEHKYLVLNNKYTLLLDSVSIVDDTTDSIVEDSIITVRFEGEKKKINYNGKTEYNLLSNVGTYSLDIIIPDITIRSEIYLDSLKFIRQRVFADGVLIDNAETEIDSQVMLLIRNSELITQPEENFWDRIGVFGETGTGSPQKSVKFDTYYLGLGVYVDIGERFNISLTKYVIPTDEYIYLSLGYSITARDIIRQIFK